jgi:hypothetical protein
MRPASKVRHMHPHTEDRRVSERRRAREREFERRIKEYMRRTHMTGKEEYDR